MAALVESHGWNNSFLKSAYASTFAPESDATTIICFFSNKCSQYFLNGGSSAMYSLNMPIIKSSSRILLGSFTRSIIFSRKVSIARPLEIGPQSHSCNSGVFAASQRMGRQNDMYRMANSLDWAMISSDVISTNRHRSNMLSCFFGNRSR